MAACSAVQTEKERTVMNSQAAKSLNPCSVENGKSAKVANTSRHYTLNAILSANLAIAVCRHRERVRSWTHSSFKAVERGPS